MGHSGGGGFTGQDAAASAAEMRKFNLSLARAKKEAAEAESQAALATSKAQAAEQLAMERAQKEAIQAMEQAAAKEVEVTDVAGAPDIGEIVTDRPEVQGMGFLQIPEDEEEGAENLSSAPTEIRGY